MSSTKRPPISNESSLLSESDTLPSFQGNRKSHHVFPKWHINIRGNTPSDTDYRQRRKRITRRLIWSALVIIFVASLAIVTWLALILTVANRLQMPHLNNGLYDILKNNHLPNLTHLTSSTWLEDFSAGVFPVRCHSHNDYLHRFPLYEGLAAGCVSTEIDIWLGNTTDGRVDLFVGHAPKSLSQSRTLRSLYLDPLTEILKKQNEILSDDLTISRNPQSPNGTAPVGVFSMASDTSLVLLLDFKTTDDETWKTVISQLDSLRARGWLTYWSPTKSIVQRPLTIVATGKVTFSSITANTTYRDIFYDAPLTELMADTPYNSNNSYYASSSLKGAIGTVRLGKLSKDQKSKVTEQVERADELGLKSRYWDIPSWPISWRNHIWGVLVELGVGVLNVDDLIAAARWDWKMCVVGGLNICAS